MDATGLSGWASVPIFNGSLPGNQAAMGGGAPVSTGGFEGAVVGKIMEGGQIGPSATSMIAAVLGFSASVGATRDVESGLTCMIETTCGIIGPIIGGAFTGGYTAQTGKVTPGDVSWSVGGVGAATVGWGGVAEFSLGADGAIGVSGGASGGGVLGGGVQICRQRTSNVCGKIGR